MRYQTTLKTAVAIEGVGLHSGRPVKVLFRPAPANYGLVFVRADRPDLPIPASPESARAFDYATTLGRENVTIGTVEHCLSAAMGAQLDNCRIEVEGPELPILDGSALPFVRLFHAAGIIRQKTRVAPFSVDSPIEIRSNGKVLTLGPGSGLTITYEIDFPHPVIGKQSLTVRLTPQEYAAQIAPARTFGFVQEAEMLRARGLALGGSVHNAVVLDDRGVISGPLRFRDEFVRHKILDLIGDLALLGRPLEGHLYANRAGHALHFQLVDRLLKGDLPAAPAEAAGETATAVRA
jgi:UDP-3-O-[3-hydroxymyristoyl] N-acetylglucosamine deacetylase